MRYVELVSERPLLWGLFLVYMVGTSFLAWLGHKKTTGMASFAVGNGDMAPWVVGVTLAASLASTATFVINPGFVYVHGLSALMHLGVAASAGVVCALLVLSPGFRRVGEKTGAITLPHWVGERYGSPGMRIFFSFASMLSFTFVVLIVGGLALVMQATLGLSNTEAALLIIAFVFSYIFVGGAYAHAYTNTFQGLLMVVVAITIVGQGAHLLFEGDFVSRLSVIDPDLAGLSNPNSPLFDGVFSVWVAGFIIGFAVVCQPHVLTKALYVKSDSAVRRYLVVTIMVSLVFTGLLLVGLYAHLASLPKELLIDPVTGVFRQDRVMAVWITTQFSPSLTAVITVCLLAAGMSTLDGLLVALSSTVAFDLFLGLAPKEFLDSKTPEQRSHLGHRASQLVLLLMGVVAFIVVLNPPKLLGIFGQIGVYGVVAASVAPVLCGIAFSRPPTRPVFAASVIALAMHLGLYMADFHANPAVTATWGILASLAIAVPASLMNRTEDAGISQ